MISLFWKLIKICQELILASFGKMVVERFWFYLVSWIYLDNTHISVNNPQNDTKPGRTDSPHLNVEKRTHCMRDNTGREGREKQTLMPNTRCGEPAWGRQVPVAFGFENQRT